MPLRPTPPSCRSQGTLSAHTCDRCLACALSDIRRSRRAEGVMMQGRFPKSLDEEWTMNVKTMLDYADAHGQAIRDSDESHAQADLSPEFRERANAIATTLPHPVTAYEVVSVSVSDGV